ncbi:hypothetical protein [Inmirania thermothiophila]|uniref:Uncharacterized protein n=1 Tax=Inmirania thermothiophila TaxID=1750597 RepID=A0A3N1XSD0_9GAMM|nr:hypothetical protein [Inmirania thermothiophila]ROR29560.1 hypothetical protein EDC57_2231 [Inmirania thermothiophila]
MSAPFLPTVPEPRAYANPLVERRPARVQAWVDSLPLMDLPRVAAMLEEALAALAREPVPARERLRLLRIYAEPVRALYASFSGPAGGPASLSTAQRLALSDRLGRILLALAAGYKLVVREGRGQRRDPRRDRLVLEALQRALDLQAQVLLHAFRTYAAPPPHAYRELHQLFLYAEQGGVAQRADAEGVAPEDRYKRILLVAAADPFRLQPGEAELLDDALEGLAPAARLFVGGCGGGHGRFVIDPAADRPPEPCLRLPPERARRPARILDAGPLRAALEGMAAGPRAGTVTPLQLALLRRIVPQLESPALRRLARRLGEGRVGVALGLAAVHWYLGEEGRAALRPRRAESAYGIEVYEGGEEAPEAPAHSLHEFVLGDESEGGVGLESEGTPPPGLAVGELAAVFRGERLMAAGVVRWVRREADGGLAAGIARLRCRLLPVRIRPVRGEAGRFPDQPALYCAADPARRVPASLITRRILYEPDLPLVVEGMGRTAAVRAGSLILDSGRIARFTLRRPRPGDAP